MNSYKKLCILPILALIEKEKFNGFFNRNFFSLTKQKIIEIGLLVLFMGA